MIADAQEFYDRHFRGKGLQLTQKQKELLLHACKLSIAEHDDLQSARIAAGVYLNYILKYPDLELPPVKKP